MQILIWMGAAAALIGFLGLVMCILKGLRAKRSGLDDTQMRAELQRLVVLNMTAMGISVLGLAMVVAGIMLS